jgi:serine protease Do
MKKTYLIPILLIIFSVLEILKNTSSCENLWSPKAQDTSLKDDASSTQIWTESNPKDAFSYKIPIPSISSVIKKISPATLIINTEFVKRTNNEGSSKNVNTSFSNVYTISRKIRGQASGFIIHPSGLALTNQHVIDNAEKVIVRVGSNTCEYEAEIIGQNVQADIALIKIKSSISDWPSLPLGHSCNLNAGDFAIAIGNPLGLELSVSLGIISACERSEIMPSGRRGIYNFIQFDAPINPGNSGGPLLNLSGEVIGINTATSTVGQGIGFAIPIDQVKSMLFQLNNSGCIQTAWIGVKVQSLSIVLAKKLKLRSACGVIVNKVITHSPAYNAGVQVGDIITHFNGVFLKNHLILQIQTSLSKVGSSIFVHLIRNKKQILCEIIVSDLENRTSFKLAKHKTKRSIYLKGKIVSHSEYIKYERYYGVKFDDIRNVVTVLNKCKKLKKRDAIIKINDLYVDSSYLSARIINSIERGKVMYFIIKRNNQIFFINIIK